MNATPWGGLESREMKEWNEVFSSAVFRLIVIVLAVVIPLNLLTLILGGTVITEVERQVSLETQNALQLYINQMDDAMARIDLKMYLIAHSDADFSRLNDKEVVEGDEYYRQLQSVVRLGNTLDDTLDDHTLMDGLFVYFPEKDYFIREGSTMQQNTAIRDYMVENAASLQENDYRSWHVVNTNGGAFLLLASGYRHAYYGAWISLQALGDRVGMFEDEDGVLSAFTDETGVVYLANRDDMTQLDLSASHQKYSGESYTLVKVQSQQSDLCYVQILSKSQITNALPIAIRVLQILSVVAVVIIPVIAIAIQRWVVRPVGMLVNAMERIERGDVGYRIPKTRVGSEFDRINGHFNHMMDEVSELKIQMYEQQIKAEKTRLGFLSQQIQPHFILNALNILYSYEPEEYRLSRTMILCLSKYFRYVVNANADYVELGQELEHIRNYFGIQQARYLRAFRSEVNCDETLSDCLIPPLIVQNFTENAIKHALVPEQVIDITVEARKTAENKLHICISDNGAGIPEDILRRIHEFRRTRDFRSDLGVGIQNAIDRLEIIYGGQASLEIGRQAPQGTRIDIVLPIQRKETDLDERDPY